jgi:hypothetical protein
MPTPLTDFEKKKQFLLEHEDFLLGGISHWFKLTHQQLTSFQTLLNWDYIVCNLAINWTSEIMDEFKDRVFIDELYPKININDSLPWSIEFIERYEDRWNWYLLGRNHRVMGNPEIRKHFHHRVSEHIEAYERWSASPINYEMRSLDEVLETQIKELDKHKECLFRSAEEIDSIEDINWLHLSSNEFLPWSAELIEKYKEEWDWRLLSRNGNIPWSLELIKQFEDKIEWGSGMFDEYDDDDVYDLLFDIYSLSANPTIEWDAEIISTFRKKLHKPHISLSERAKWDIDLLIQFADFWDYRFLAINDSMWQKVFPEFDSEEQIKELLGIVLERRK